MGYEIKITRIVLSDASPQCLEGQGGKEEIVFISQRNDKKVYSNNEIRSLAEGNIEYYFTAIPARAIRIEIRDQSSCLANQKILSIGYIE